MEEPSVKIISDNNDKMNKYRDLETEIENNVAP